MHTALVTLLAVLLDRLLGEPRRAHPLVGFGRLAYATEARLNRAGFSPDTTRMRGVLAVAVLLIPIVLLSALAVRVPMLTLATEVLLLYLALGGQSLGQHARAVAQALDTGDLALARTRVGYMVSRDTGGMRPEDVARATVESVLENGNDAVFGALFWFVVAGAPGTVLYRLVNTLDAMWGYRSPRYMYFGWAAARLDDVLNFVPARLTAFTYAVLGRYACAWYCWRTQGNLWESPNAGPVMAAGAGALGVQLGGCAMYHGTMKQRALLGAGAQPTPGDIARAVALVNHGLWLWLAAIVIGGMWLA